MGCKSLSLLAFFSLLHHTQASEVRQADVQVQDQLPADGRTDRDGKFLSVFQIVRFQNEMCPASTGEMGTCYTEAECTAKGGVASGSCATGFGVCCVFTLSECDSTVAQDNTYIQSPDYPGDAPLGMCMYNLGKCDAGICQFKIIFEDVVLSQPDSGDCTNDTLMFSGFDDVSERVVPMTLCGDLSGQEMYVSVKDVTDPAKMVFNIIQTGARWRIKIDQIPCTETDNLAPRGCLTYAMGETGVIQSFNFASGMGQLINNQMFSHCIQGMDGFCDVELTSSNFDLGGGDSLTFSGNSQTGSELGSMGMLTWNFTGPYVATAVSNDMNTQMNEGYSIDYMLLPC